MRIEDYEPVLAFVDHEGSQQAFPLVHTPSLVPVDIGVCGFSSNYTNFDHMLSLLARRSGGTGAVQGTLEPYEYGREVSYGIEVDGLVLRSDRLAWGQLWKPWNWYRAIKLSTDTDKMVRYCREKGLAYWRTKTVTDLRAEMEALNICETTIAWMLSFCQVGSGFSNTQFSEISAAYWYHFFTQGNFHNLGAHNMIFMYGTTAYIATLTAHIVDRGVRVEQGQARRGRHTIYAIQPFDSADAGAVLPPIEQSTALAYVHCDGSIVANKRLNTVLVYGEINGIAQASWDVDAMRPDHPDVGAFVTFTTPDHEEELDAQLFKGGSPLYMHEVERNDHNLYETPLKVRWRHGVIDVAAERARRDFWRDAQGANHTWYCGSTYLKCMLHENAITSALDAVCLLTGAQAKLEARGFRVSDDTLELHRGD